MSQSLRWFCIDLGATKISQICVISEVSLCRLFKQIRILMMKECEKFGKFNGEIEIDESYFGAKRIRGKRGCGASGKTPVFGLLKRNGKVYTQIVKNCSAKQA